MALIRLDQNKAVPYVPFSERKNTKDPLTIHIKYVPALLHDEYFTNLAMAKRNATTEVEAVAISQSHDKQMFMDRVVQVDNFLDSEGNQITNLSEFYESIDFNLRAEIVDAMISQARLTAGQRKNL